MSIFLTVLKIIGMILLVLLALLLVILLSPVFYEGEGVLEDPDGSEDVDAEKLQQNASGRFHFHYLFHAVRGGIAYPTDPTFRVKVLWMEILPKKEAEGEGKEPEKPANAAQQQLDEDIANGLAGRGEEETPDSDANSSKTCDQASENTGKRKATFEEFLRHYYRKIHKKCIALYDKIKDVIRHLDYYKRLWEMQATQHTVSKMQHLLAVYLPKLLPRQWELRGTLGLGDPAMTGKLLEVMGFVYPFICDHVEVTPEFMLYRFDLKGHAKGRIVPMTLVILALRVVLDKEIRKTFKRVKNAEKSIERHYATSK